MPETTSGDGEPAAGENGDDLLEESGSIGDDVVDTGDPASGPADTVAPAEDEGRAAGGGGSTGRPARVRTRDKAPAEAPAPVKGRKLGRITPKGGASQVAAKSGRYTPPIPKEKRKSPVWYGWTLLAFLVVGLLLIVLNYVNVLPGGTSNWYLIAGIASIVVGLFMATFYH